MENKIISFLLFLFIFSSCITNRLSSNYYYDKFPERNNQNINLSLETFSIENYKAKYFDKRRLILNFLHHLHNSTNFNKIINNLNQKHTSDEPALLIEIKLKPDITTRRTYYFDLMALYPVPFWFGLLTPEWGTTSVELEIKSSPNSAIQINPINLKIENEYTFFIYSWFRGKILNDEFEDMYENIFKKAAKLLQNQHNLILAEYQKKGVSIEKNWPYKPEINQPVNEHIIKPSKNFPKIIKEFTTEPTKKNKTEIQTSITFENYLKTLGGLEYTSFSGKAKVNSKTITSTGTEETIASGNAESSGYKISLNSPAKKTGYYFSPTLGFFSQEINIADFKADFKQPEILNTENIPLITSDPKTGFYVDAESPNIYNLELKSIFIGQKIGHDLLIGFQNKKAVWFFSPQASINLAEYRTTGIKLGSFSSQGNNWEFLKSGEIIFSTGIWFRPLHLCFKLSGDWNYFNQFKFPQKVYFKEMPAYNPNEQVFVRKLTTVDSASFNAFNFLFSVNYIF